MCIALRSEIVRKSGQRLDEYRTFFYVTGRMLGDKSKYFCEFVKFRVG